MRILITGGTGFVGSRLIARMQPQGHEFVVLTRNAEKARRKLGMDTFRIIEWDTRSPIPPDAFQGVEAAVNLVGESIASKRWSSQQKKKIINSRVEPTRALVDGINAHAPQCRALVSASAIGYYPVNHPEPLEEESEPAAGFMSEICQKWEAEAERVNESTRLVIVRIGVVLGRGGGVVGRLMPIFKAGLGGPVSDGSQMMSWIHLEDLAGILSRGLKEDSMRGVYNAVAPHPVTNREFSKAFAKALGRPALLPAPAFMLRATMGEMADIVLDSQAISGRKVQEEGGYSFLYPRIEHAMNEIAGRS
ncbi:TIGR01777 family oxidoreductase [Ectothiorhodospira sp. BSL-9]|uniref:TIGR01777 family oxidoreductase n=1 Tax=Ectothiorhodospira sp. BSL-9 TaxID=1442136 RepID=UPI0007B4432D|nr:TIGR01777 family oxidoreductase [Ectothiorhodospira sp. BSL-9]ANB02672.1 hypothetical protein ECTOBSL9_2124 [Ectothiorhodospira sp. BSL-9]